MKHILLTTTALLLLAAPAAAQDITDAQIASIVVTANQVDIDAGKLAVSKATNTGVRAFGERMAADHMGVNKAAVELATRLKVTPEANATSASLKAAGDKNLAHLKTLSGNAFDKAYIDNEVAYHQQVIDALDTVLIPGAQNAELKALLVKVRPAFVAHLDQAKKLQATVTAGAKAPAVARRARTHTVTIDGSRFSPAQMSVARGDRIVWKNADLVAHTATSAAGGFDSKMIAPGKSWTYVATKAGAFAYLCTYHPSMTASLRVR